MYLLCIKKHSVQLIRTEQRYDNNKPLGRLAKKKSDPKV